MFCVELCRRLYWQYEFIKNILLISLRPDTRFLLLNLTSEIKIMSVLNLAMPYILFFCKYLPLFAIFSELQFILENVRSFIKFSSMFVCKCAVLDIQKGFIGKRQRDRNRDKHSTIGGHRFVLLLILPKGVFLRV